MKKYFILSTEGNRKNEVANIGHYVDTPPPAGVDYSEYYECDGTWFHASTPVTVVHILQDAQRRRERLVLWYGDNKTGRAWGDIETGYIGRSTGAIKIPLLVHNSRSTGGPAILDDCIVKIATSRGRKVLYQHPEFHEKAN